MGRKASLSLSVNAIVVLILAIVMLGLGLGFIRGMFGKVSTQIEEQIAAEPEPAIPSGEIPVTLSRESIVTHAGDKEVLKVSAFNPSNQTWFSKRPGINCTELSLKEPESNSKTINQGELGTFTILINIPSTPPNTYLCQTNMEGYEKDFTIKITK